MYEIIEYLCVLHKATDLSDVLCQYFWVNLTSYNSLVWLTASNCNLVKSEPYMNLTWTWTLRFYVLFQRLFFNGSVCIVTFRMIRSIRIVPTGFEYYFRIRNIQIFEYSTSPIDHSNSNTFLTQQHWNVMFSGPRKTNYPISMVAFSMRRHLIRFAPAPFTSSLAKCVWTPFADFRVKRLATKQNAEFTETG